MGWLSDLLSVEPQVARVARTGFRDPSSCSEQTKQYHPMESNLPDNHDYAGFSRKRNFSTGFFV